MSEHKESDPMSLHTASKELASRDADAWGMAAIAFEELSRLKRPHPQGFRLLAIMSKDPLTNEPLSYEDLTTAYGEMAVEARAKQSEALQSIFDGHEPKPVDLLQTDGLNQTS